MVWKKTRSRIIGWCAGSISATAIKSLLRRGQGIARLAVSSVSYGLDILKIRTCRPYLLKFDIVLAVAPVSILLFWVRIGGQMNANVFFREKHLSAGLG